MTQTLTRPSARSISYLTDLVRDRDVDPGSTAIESLAKLTKWLSGARSQTDVSAMIDRAKLAPRRTMVATTTPGVYTPYPSVPATVINSKYAIMTGLLDEIPSAWRSQDYLFFEVKEYRGRRSINRLTGAPGAFNRSTIPGALASEIYRYLEQGENMFLAAKTFGIEYRCCGKCAADLTDDQSRARQFGPICWGYMEALRGN